MVYDAKINVGANATDVERDAARAAWDRAMALQGPTQTTNAGLEIPIPSREDFIANMGRVAAPTSSKPNTES